MPWQQFQWDFYNTVWPIIVEATEGTGLFPEIVFAQAALESDWGRKDIGFNLFGIKGKGKTVSTREFVNGRWVTTSASFRTYSSFSDSVKGYVDFIFGNNRYVPYRTAPSLNIALQHLQQSGYATTPNYGETLWSIIKGMPNAPELGALMPMGDRVNGGLPSLSGLNPFSAIANSDFAKRASLVTVGIILLGLAIAALIFLD